MPAVVLVAQPLLELLGHHADQVGGAGVAEQVAQQDLQRLGRSPAVGRDNVLKEKNDRIITGDIFGHLCGIDCALRCRKIEFLKKILEFLTKILPDDVIVTIKI